MNKLNLKTNSFNLVGIAKKNDLNILEIDNNTNLEHFKYRNEVVLMLEKYLNKLGQDIEYLKDAFFAKQLSKELFLVIYINRNKNFFIHLYEEKTYSNNINIYAALKDIFQDNNQVQENELLIIDNNLFEYPSFNHNFKKPEVCLLFLMFDSLKKALALADYALGTKEEDKWIKEQYHYLFT